MKKLTALFLALLLAFGAAALTACDDEEEKTDNKSNVEIVDNDGWSPTFKP